MEERFWWGRILSLAQARRITAWAGGIFAACGVLIVFPLLVLVREGQDGLLLQIAVSGAFLALSLALAIWRSSLAACGLLLLCVPGLMFFGGIGVEYLFVSDRAMTLDAMIFYVPSLVFAVLTWLAWRGFVGARAYHRLRKREPRLDTFD